MTKYPARYLRFLANHAQELTATGHTPEWVREEYQTLPPGRICTCRTGKAVLPRENIRGHQPAGPSVLVSTDWLDLVRATHALPVTWRGRTRVQLLLDGLSEQAIYDLEMGDRSQFDRLHERRVWRDTAGRTVPDQEPERGAYPWTRMARYLNQPETSPAEQAA